MSSIRFGVRSMLVNTYPLSKFNISQEEAEKYGMPYDGYDIWNADKSVASEVPKIEKRAKYFHIMFVPIFGTGVQWTIRNKSGLVFANETCLKKIKNVYHKSYAPWFTYFAPLMAILGFTVFMTWEYVDDVFRKNNNNNRIIAEKAMLTKQLDSLTPPFYVVTNRRYPRQKTFKKVDSIIDKTFYLSALPTQIDTFKSNTEYYFYHKAFKKYKLETSSIQRDSLLSMIPSDSDDRTNYTQRFEVTELLPMEPFEAPMLEFKFHLSGITIHNTGKPVTLIDFTDNSEDKNNWDIALNQYIDSDGRLRALYRPNAKETQITSITLTFSADEEIYDYYIYGTYNIRERSRYFSKDSVKLIQ